MYVCQACIALHLWGLTTGPGAKKGLRPNRNHNLPRPPGTKQKYTYFRTREIPISESEKYIFQNQRNTYFIIRETQKKRNVSSDQPAAMHCHWIFRYHRSDHPAAGKTKTFWNFWISAQLFCKLKLVALVPANVEAAEEFILTVTGAVSCLDFVSIFFGYPPKNF